MVKPDDPDDRERREQEREREREILEDVYLGIHEDKDPPGAFRRRTRPLDRALHGLAQLDVPRLLKHRALISAALKHPDLIDENENAVRAVLESAFTDRPDEEAADEAQRQRPVGDERERAVEEGLRILEEFAEEAAAPRTLEDAQDEWVRRTHLRHRYASHERTFQAGDCDDARVVVKRSVDEGLRNSRLIVAQFHTNVPPMAFLRYIDPEKWPQCSDLWEAMTPTSDKVQIGDQGGYDCDFEERVRLYGETVAVPLVIGFRVTPDRVWARFNMTRGAPEAEVDVDTGTVSAERILDGPAKTLVRATKYIHWRDPEKQMYTEFACEFGYPRYMLEMARRCSEGPVAGVPGEPPVDLDQAISRLLTDVTRDCRSGIDDYKDPAKKMIGRFTGPSWDLRWVNDLLDMGGVTVKTYQRVGKHVRRFSDSLRDLDRDNGGTAGEADGEGGPKQGAEPEQEQGAGGQPA